MSANKIKYQTLGTSLNITPVRITRETEKSIWSTEICQLGGKAREVMSLKTSSFYCYHDTYLAACEYLSQRLEKGIITNKRIIEKLHGRIYKAEKRITELERMKEAGE